MVLVHSCPRAVALYCLLTQAGYSLHRKLRFPALCALLSASQTESSLMVPVHSCPRAVALHCLLTQAGHSLHRKLRFPALCALLSASQTGCSLMGLKKTNAAFAALVFFGTHYIITTFTLKCYWIFCQMYCQLYAFFLCTCIKTCCFPDLCYIKFERYS